MHALRVNTVTINTIELFVIYDLFVYVYYRDIYILYVLLYNMYLFSYFYLLSRSRTACSTLSEPSGKGRSVFPFT